MKPSFQPLLANGPFADPVLLLDFVFARRALLFDAGDLRAIPTRKLLRVSDVFVSHRHMDHFADFDWLLRLILGRPKRLRVYGSQGLVDAIGHKLAAYSWNLVANYAEAMEVEAIEMLSSASARRELFRCQNRFQPEGEGELWLDEGLLLEDPAVRVRATSLDHGVTSLGFCAEEPMHVNVWKNRLEEMNLLVGPWLGKFKDAIMAGKPDDTPIRAWRRGLNTIETPEFSLGELREQIVRIVPGQRVGYVVDVRYTEANVERIVALVKGADHLFIESPFLDEDAEQAATKNHLTARQAGTIARLAGVKALTVFHFSPRYTDRESALRAEALAAFEGR